MNNIHLTEDAVYDAYRRRPAFFRFWRSRRRELRWQVFYSVDPNATNDYLYSPGKCHQLCFSRAGLPDDDGRVAAHELLHALENERRMTGDRLSVMPSIAVFGDVTVPLINMLNSLVQDPRIEYELETRWNFKRWHTLAFFDRYADLFRATTETVQAVAHALLYLNHFEIIRALDGAAPRDPAWLAECPAVAQEIGIVRGLMRECGDITTPRGARVLLNALLTRYAPLIPPVVGVPVVL